MTIQKLIKNIMLPVLTILVLFTGVKAQETNASASDTSDVRTIKIVGTDQMKFDVTEIEAEPGETIRIKIVTVSRIPKQAMAHNFVLLTQDADVKAYINESAKARDNKYLAPNMEDQVIAATDLAGGDETVEVTFTVPEEEGEYEYVCTFPGHYYGGMKGILTVKENSAS